MKTDNLLSDIEQIYANLAKQEKNVAKVISDDYPLSALNTVADLSSLASVSTATVLRFVNKLGFDNYGLFQDAVKVDIKNALDDDPAQKVIGLSPSKKELLNNTQSIYQQIMSEFAFNLQALNKPMIESDFNAVLTLIADKNLNIFCIGGRVSSHIADLFAQYLSTIRPNVRYISGQAEGWSRYLIEVDKNSVVFVYDIRSYQSSLKNFIHLAQKNEATIVCITDQWFSTSWFSPDFVFKLSSKVSSPIESLTSQLAFTEALLAGYIKMNNQQVRKRMEKLDKFSHISS